MSAAEVLTSLAAAGAELVAEPAGLRVLAPVRLPGALLTAARDVKPALLRVASGRWRLDLAGWPGWRREAFEERAAIREHDGRQPRDLAERCAYLEAAELPDPAEAPAPEPSWAQLEQPADPAQLEAPGPELPPDVDPADPAAPSPPLATPPAPAPVPARLPAHLRDTPEAWAAFLDEAPWLGPAERRRILADAFGSSPTPRPRSHP